MSPSGILQLIFSGLTVGSIYAMVAMGFNIIYNSTGIINLAQGEFVMLGGMTMIWLVERRALGWTPLRALAEIGPPAVEAMIESVRRKDYAQEDRMIRALGWIGDPRAGELLIEVLGGEQASLHAVAAQALGKLPADPAAADVLLARLGSEDWRVRQYAADGLARLGEPRAIEPLRALLKDPDLTVRGHAAQALGELGASAAADEIALLLDDALPFVRRSAVIGLSRLKDARVVTTIRRQLPEATAADRQELARLLARVGTPEAAEVLCGLLAHEDSLVLTSSDSGRVVWDMDRFRFISGPAPATVNPSLWRQEQLNNVHGVFELADRVFQVRGYDISNISFIQGDTGWIVIDPLISAEPAAAALELLFANLGEAPVVAGRVGRGDHRVLLVVTLRRFRGRPCGPQ